MNIDLLFTRRGEAGLICSENLVQKAIGVLFDPKSRMMSLEFADMDTLEFNIPIEPEYFEMLDLCGQLHIGAVKNSHIAQAYQIPLMFLDDPYRAEALSNVRQPANPLNAFNRFVQSCAFGQPVHRDDLGDEAAMGCILGEASPANLQFAPHLARRAAMEAKPSAAPAPRGPGLSAPGLGGSTSSGGTVPRSPPSHFSDDE